LVAYIIIKQRNDGNGDEHEAKAQMVQELRILLEERLPAYMVPSHFMVLDKWPLSPNGKVDRTALPSPTRGGYVTFPCVCCRARACAVAHAHRRPAGSTRWASTTLRRTRPPNERSSRSLSPSSTSHLSASTTTSLPSAATRFSACPSSARSKVRTHRTLEP
jgi:hypothetical protein